MSDHVRDPREEPLRPTREEVEAWASLEHKRREVWIAGPTQDEQDEWARGYRRHAALGLAESRLGPTAEEVAEWADREHKRRQAWVAGPTAEEKRERARLQPLAPPEQIDAWAEDERQRRVAWVAGPTEHEKDRWIRQQSGSVWDRMGMDSDALESARRVLREADLATKGSLDVLLRTPLAIWSYLVRSGAEFEDEFYQPPRRRRVRF